MSKDDRSLCEVHADNYITDLDHDAITAFHDYRDTLSPEQLEKFDRESGYIEVSPISQSEIYAPIRARMIAFGSKWLEEHGGQLRSL